jgi:hypothetical protein
VTAPPTRRGGTTDPARERGADPIGADARLAALAALFAPHHAAALLARAAGAPGGEAARLAAAPRRDRLAALASSTATDPATARARAEAAAAVERPRIAGLLRVVAAGGNAPAVAAALLRLCRERIAR